jgi:endoglucanase
VITPGSTFTIRRCVRTLTVGGAVVTVLCACGASASQHSVQVAQSRAAHADPIAGGRLYVDPNSPASQAARQLQAAGDAHDAQLLGRIAGQPTATWFAHDSPLVESQVSSLTSLAGGRGELPVLVAYDIPKRDCGSGYSSGGAASAAAYLAWIGRLSGGIGTRRAVVILEPDAIPGALSGCLSATAARDRFALLKRAVAIFKRDPGAVVYIDVGNPSWITSPARLVTPLREAGIAMADGFALNVANFQSTAASVTYGDRLAHLLGGRRRGVHFVIDTSRNGNGPDVNPGDGPNWCNPPGRALGHAPTTSTGQPLVDAYLWVKRPGESDGSCRPGAPPAGQFWTQYALGLAAAG